MTPAHGAPPRSRGAFTLIELLVSLAVLTLLVLLSFRVTDQVTEIWQRTSASIGQWQKTRTAFDSLTRRLSLATLDPTWAYFDASGALTDTDPVRYGRHSQLHFVTGPASSFFPPEALITTQALFFQAPLGRTQNADLSGLPHLLSSCGFFIQYGSDAAFRPPGVLFENHEAKWRFRLMEFIEPSERLQVYQQKGAEDYDWFRRPVTRGFARPLAENVIALFVIPRLSSLDLPPLSDETPLPYGYNSRKDETSPVSGASLHQLPPLVQVTLVALSDHAARRLAETPASDEPGRFAAIQALLFADAPFASVAHYEHDLQKLEENLIRARLDYKVYSGIIALRGAKWNQNP